MNSHCKLENINLILFIAYRLKNEGETEIIIIFIDRLNYEKESDITIY